MDGDVLPLNLLASSRYSIGVTTSVSSEVRVVAISQRASAQVNVSLHLKERILLGVLIGVVS